MPPKKETFTPFKFLGFEIPLPRWAVYAVAMIAVLSFSAYMWSKLIPEFKPKGTVEIPQSEFVQIQEAQKHIIESPEAQLPVFSDVRGDLKVFLYRSDGCLLVSRRGSDPQSSPVNFWLLDPTRSPSSPPPGATSGSLSHFEVGMLSSPAFAQGGCQGNCLNPHPGEFAWWNGERRDCWIQVWRRWPDGCSHYQWWNTCTNSWDVNPDGSPRVYWVSCCH